MSTLFDITDHAVQQYIARHAPGSTSAQARAHLEALLLNARPLKERSINDDPMWRVEDPVITFVVKPDGRKQVVVTVLPAGACETMEDVFESEIGAERDEVLAAYERIRPLLERSGKAGNPVTEINNLRQQLTALALKHERRVMALERQLAIAKAQVDSMGAHRSSTQINTLRQQIEALSRKYQRQIAHGDRMTHERSCYQRAYKLAIEGDTAGAMSCAAAAKYMTKEEAITLISQLKFAALDEGLRGLAGSAEDVELRLATTQSTAWCIEYANYLFPVYGKRWRSTILLCGKQHVRGLALLAGVLRAVQP